MHANVQGSEPLGFRCRRSMGGKPFRVNCKTIGNSSRLASLTKVRSDFRGPLSWPRWPGSWLARSIQSERMTAPKKGRGPAFADPFAGSANHPEAGLVRASVYTRVSMPDDPGPRMNRGSVLWGGGLRQLARSKSVGVDASTVSRYESVADPPPPESSRSTAGRENRLSALHAAAPRARPRASRGSPAGRVRRRTSRRRRPWATRTGRSR